MINLTTADIGKLARLSNGLVFGPLKQFVYSDGSVDWYISDGNFAWSGDGSPTLYGGPSIVEVLDMPTNNMAITKKLTITKDDVGRWVKLRNGWVVGPIVTVGKLDVSVSELGNFHLNGAVYSGSECSRDIIAVVATPDQEDHA